MRIELLALALLPFVSCKSKILIVVSENEKSGDIVNLIKSVGSSDFKYEETSKYELPPLINVQTDQLNYHTVYFLKSAWYPYWTSDIVGAYMQKGGNLLTCTDDAGLLNEFGLDVFKGSAAGAKGQWNPQHAFSAFKSDEVSVSKESFAFKLRNDARSPKFNPLILNAMSLSPGSAVCNDSKSCLSSNQAISFLTTLESRTGSRFLAVTSNALLSSLSTETKIGMFSWLQKSKFIIKIASISHQLSDESLNHLVNRGKTELDSTIYRIKDSITVRMCLVNENHQRFIPLNPSDFQFELKMMNIQVRKSFDLIDEDGCLQARHIQLPPKPAIYTLQVNYNRPGWSQLSHSEKLLVRPYRFDEFPRYLMAALPYYLSWFGILFASYMILLPSILRNESK